MQLIQSAHVIQAAGAPPKSISEFVGRLATGDSRLSIALMDSPSGWSEPGQSAAFEEFTVVLAGELLVETTNGSFAVQAGQAVHVTAGEWVRYSTPSRQGAKYLAVCLPAFSPESVHRDPPS